MNTHTTGQRSNGQDFWRQSGAGLLLAAVLMVSPLSSLAQGEISTSSTTGADLDTLFGPPTNSVTVDPGVTINNTTSGSDAVSGSSQAWYLTNNAASLNGNVNGVNFQSGGSVDNLTSGSTITGGQEGVVIGGGDGAVFNAGSITGTNDVGVFFSDSGSTGTLHNATGGTIQGGNYGAYLNGDGTVVNGGTITGGSLDGVYIEDYNGQDWVNNQQGGLIQGGQNGIFINYPGAVTNAGVIIGSSGYGVYVDGNTIINQSGAIVNQTGGFIEGGTNGVNLFDGAGTVANDGIIIGDSNDGVFAGSGGSVGNSTNGIIQGGMNGVEITGDVGSVANDGVITGVTNNGVQMGSGGSVVNGATGMIQAGQNGVQITGPNASVLNAGTISAQNGYGVYVGAGAATVTNSGSITSAGSDGVFSVSGGTALNNQSGAVISAAGTGVNILGSGSVVNVGTITGTNGDGVYLGDGSTVDNQTGATISGNGNAGVWIQGGGAVNNDGTIAGANYGLVTTGTGSVTNTGSISGGNNDGVSINFGGYASNSIGATISGGANGVTITGGAGSLDNGGSITGTNGIGVYMDSGGSVNNQAGANITGGVTGVAITNGLGSVDNAGSISGNHDGVLLAGGGSVNNQAGATISGNTYAGVEINGTAGSVTNAGTITGEGVFFTAGGSVVNQSDGLISGNHFAGVEIIGGDGSVDNAGTIVSSNGPAILFDAGSFNNSVTLEAGSVAQGDIVGGAGTDTALLLGNGVYSNNFLNFETLTVQADTNGWNLTGTNSFSTGSTVESGLLRVNGTLSTPLLTVLAAPTNGLAGSGTITGNVDNHGYFAPGNSIGTLTILGSLTNWGDYHAQFSPTASDRILVGGAATINGGTLFEDLQSGIYGVQTTYNVLTATNGVFGTYAGSVSNITWAQSVLFPITGVSVVYDANNVSVVVNRAAFTSVAQTFNQNSVAGALDKLTGAGATPGTSNLVSQFYWQTSAAAARAALNSMGGDLHGTLGMLDVRQQDDFNGLIAQRTGRISAGARSGDFATSWKPVQLTGGNSAPPPMEQAEVDQPLDFWVQGIGSFGHLDGDGNAQGGNFTVGGMGGGLDYRATPELLGGLALGYSRDSADVGGPGANGTVDDYQVAGYGGYVQGPWHLDGILSYGMLHTDSKRLINVGTISQQANGSYNGGVMAVSTEGGYAFDWKELTVEPTLGLNYAHLWQDSFSETGFASDGNNYGLNVNSVKMDSVRSSMGVRLSAQLGAMDSVQYLLALHALWEHEFVDRYADVNASFVGGGSAFDIHGVELGPDTARLGGGLTVAFTKSVQGFVGYEAGLNSKITSSTVSGGLSVSW